MVFGVLTVNGKATPSADKSSRWHCRCVCGNESVFQQRHLRSGHSKSCGCLRFYPRTDTPPTPVSGCVWVPLSQGLFTNVDEPDYALISNHTWYAAKERRRVYARRNSRGGPTKFVKMHRTIAGAPVGVEVDHINGNGLDNRRANLRLCSNPENTRNQGLSIANTSGFKGVTWRRKECCWRAQIGHDRANIYLGSFPTAIEAALAYDAAARRFFGAFARPNFPITQETTT